MESSPTAVVWFRRDLRLSDHPALSLALSRFDRVVPLFIWDPVLTAASGPNRLSFLAGCVEALRDALSGRLVLRSGEPARMVSDTAEAAGASAVYVTADFGPYGTARDEAVADALRGAGRQLVAVDSPYAVAPGRILTAAGSPFQVFSPYMRAWDRWGWDAPRRRPSLARIDPAGLSGSGRGGPDGSGRGGPDGSGRGGPGGSNRHPAARPASGLPPAGEAAAHGRLDRFLRSQADRYRGERDRPDLDSTSRLSAYLRFGCLHPRQILARLEPGNPSHERFRAELCWRDFYADVLYHRPDAARRPYRQEWRAMAFDEGRDADERFRAWTEGRTGYPIVDAGMRQLLAEGWMHNRVRMIAASFLVKDLHLDWVLGARWYMRHLVDGDLASNQLNWQWVAGCGTDAAPYFRVFNPVAQGRKFDPDGDYIRRWVPELAGLAAGDVHEPWGSLLGSGTGYPAPIVDHAEERREALARYGRLRR